MGFTNSPANDLLGYFGIRWYDSWYGNYDKEKYASYQFWHGLPFFDSVIDNNIASEKSKKYLERYHMDYSSIVDPSALYDSGNGSRTYHQLNFVSSNIRKLYR